MNEQDWFRVSLAMLVTEPLAAFQEHLLPSQNTFGPVSGLRTQNAEHTRCVDVECNEISHRCNSAERVQKQPLVFKLPLPTFDHAVRKVDVYLGQDSLDCVRLDQRGNVCVDVFDATVHVDLWCRMVCRFFDPLNSLGCFDYQLCSSIRIECRIDAPTQNTP